MHLICAFVVQISRFSHDAAHLVEGYLGSLHGQVGKVAEFQCS